MSGVKPIVLETITAKRAAIQNYEYIQARKEGKIKSLATSFTRLNYHLMGGFEYNTITTIAAPSGGGKSALAKVFRNDFLNLNPWCDFNYICFNFEMLSHQQVARQATTHFEKTLRELYSVEGTISDELLAQIKEYYQQVIQNQNLFFVERSGRPEDIAETIYQFWKNQCKPLNKVCIYEVDHTLLTLGKEGQSEREKIDKLMHELVTLKKRISSQGGNSVGLVLSQLNRDIKSTDRIADPTQHTPRTSDIFGSSSVEFASDLILVQHMPSKLGIQSYTNDEYPTVYHYQKEDGSIEEVDALYLHNIKARSGETDKIYPLENRLKYFDIKEFDLDLFDELHQEFMNTQQAIIPFSNVA